MSNKKTGSADTDALTLAELAELLKLNINTARKLATLGEIPGVKIGDSWRFSRTAIHEMLRGATKS